VTSLPVLVVEHEAQCPPGWLAEWLAEAGCAVDVRRPYLDDDLPAGLDAHRSMLVLGGSMSAGSDRHHPWLAEVKRLIRTATQGHVPVLGICLGHQLAAVALGGAVQPSPRGQRMGVHEVGWTPAAQADPMMSRVTSSRVGVQWNNDIVTVAPPGTEVLASSDDGDLQAARFATTVWGVQWHPEADAGIVRAWAEHDRASARARGVDVDEYVAQVAAAERQLRSSWQALATAFGAMTVQGART
jgi:GMP synthase (glutamine-hydrolysing)